MKDTFQLTGPMGNGFDVPDILSKYKKIAVVGRRHRHRAHVPAHP